MPVNNDLETTCINRIRTLSMDTVQSVEARKLEEFSRAKVAQRMAG
jgi:hypothetical protein